MEVEYTEKEIVKKPEGAGLSKAVRLESCAGGGPSWLPQGVAQALACRQLARAVTDREECAAF